MDSAEEDPEDEAEEVLIVRVEVPLKCTTLFVQNAEKIVKFHSDRQATNQFFVEIVSAKATAVQAEALVRAEISVQATADPRHQECPTNNSKNSTRNSTKSFKL